MTSLEKLLRASHHKQFNWIIWEVKCCHNTQESYAFSSWITLCITVSRGIFSLCMSKSFVSRVWTEDCEAVKCDMRLSHPSVGVVLECYASSCKSACTCTARKQVHSSLTRWMQLSLSLLKLEKISVIVIIISHYHTMLWWKKDT